MADFDRSRVLVADNDQIIRSIVRSLLLKLGQEVVEATHSEDAIAFASARPFDLVILDLDMPARGGLETCRHLRRMEKYEAVPIVILTAHGSTDTRLRCQAAGASRFMAKPFNPASLVRLLEPLLELDHAGADTVAQLVRQDRGLLVQDRPMSRSAVFAEAPAF